MRLTYLGPHDAVRVPLPTGGEVEVERGKSEDMPTTLAERLLEQEDAWQKTGGKKTPGEEG